MAQKLNTGERNGRLPTSWQIKATQKFRTA
jgi:hypothetical protein